MDVLIENKQLRAENERLRAVLVDVGKAFAHDGDIHFHAQPVAYRREQIRQALNSDFHLAVVNRAVDGRACPHVVFEDGHQSICALERDHLGSHHWVLIS